MMVMLVHTSDDLAILPSRDMTMSGQAAGQGRGVGRGGKQAVSELGRQGGRVV